MDRLRENLCFSVAVGVFRTIGDSLKHSGRQKDNCLRLADELMVVEPYLKRLNKKEIEILTKSITVSSNMIDSIGDNPRHTLISLGCFCMEELNHIFKPIHFRHLMTIFDSFNESDKYEAIRYGERVFERMMAELEIETAMGET